MENFKKICCFKKTFDKKSIFIHNFIESGYILDKKIIDTNNLKIIFVGRLKKFKGFNHYIRLIEETPQDIKFTIIGDGKLKTKIPQRPNVNYIGVVNNDIIFKYYDASNILILPSYSEVFPMTILEAMARGLVIVVSDIPGMREIIKEGINGYLFPPGNVEKMKEIIIYLKNNPKEIERISKNNLKDIHKFTANKQIHEYIKVYEEVLKEK